MFRVAIKLRNWQNAFLPPEEQGEDVACDALVDTGAGELALPADMIERLRLRPLDGVVIAKLADGSRQRCRTLGIVEVEVMGRTCQVRAIELPRGTEPLLGAVPLEELDWHISPREQRLLPNPK
ncbi:MAG TPA: retroviral-like aspartic protease family protein, partial [Candidatus Acidoferrales bacterium]|nr:retroviral-like aspartic protease family protein [Candidatus Acidoferrales bacterium]